MKKKLHFLLSLAVMTCCMLASTTANAQGLEDGKYYLLNVASGKYWGAGNSWGTQASLVQHPEYVTLIGNEDGTYKLESQVSNGGTKYYFAGDFMDSDAPDALTITEAGENYTISGINGYYGYDGTSTVLGKELEADSKNALWSIISEADMVASLANATAENPVDATFLILDPNFGRNNRNKGAWTAEASNKNLGGGANDNFCAESYHSTFTLSQTIENAPKGVYKLNAQGFYRQDGTDNDNLPYIYINDEKGGTFPLKTGSENNMSDASNSFTKGLYAIDPAYIELSEDGSLTVGAKLETNTTLWCIWDNFELTYYGTEASITEIKLSGLIASVKALREEATALKGNENVHANTIAVLEKALADSEEIEATEDAYNAAIDALTAAINQANKDVANKTAINAMYDILNNNNVATSEAADTYKDLADKYLESFNEGTLTETVVNPTTITGWHANPFAVSDFLISAWDEATAYNWDSYHVNTWSTEGEADGSDFKVPFIQYWTGDGESLKAKELTATVEGVEPGMYAVSAWVRVRAKDGVTATDATGITLSVNDGEAIDVTEGEQIGTSQFNIAEYTAIATVGEDGKLVITFNVAEETNISWLALKNVKYAATSVEEIAYNKALDTIENGNYYRVYTTVGEKDYYLKADGVLTADEKEANNFEFKAVKASGTLYETGWNLGCRFTNPSTGSADGAVTQVGGIRVDSKQNRDDYERQVFFLNNNGEYAVRSTNAKGDSWGANTYWTVFTDTELPTAGHGETGKQNYIWKLKDVTAESLLAAAKAVVEAKVGVGNGLFYIPEEAYNTYAEAVKTAEAIITNEEATAEEIAKAIADLKAAGEVYAATPLNAPEADKAYALALTTSEGKFYLNMDNGIRIEEEATPIYFVEQEGGKYALSNGEEYVNYEGTNTWDMAASADPYAWAIAAVEGGYTLTGNNSRFLGTNNDNGNAAGSPCYGDKQASNGNYIWTIEEYVEPVKYSITIVEESDPEYGKVEAPEKAAAGKRVSITVIPADGYELEELTVTYGEEKTPVDVTEFYSFIMPEGDVTITAKFAPETPVIAGTSYEGVIEQTLSHPQAGEMGKATAEQTVTIAEAGEGLVNITFSGFTFPVMPTTLPEFTIENVATETATDGSISYTIEEVTLSFTAATGMITNYVATLEGVQANAEATPVLKLVLQQATTNTVYFGADQAAIDAYKAAVGIGSVNSDAVKANGKFFEDGKVVIYRNGVKYGVNGAAIK